MARRILLSFAVIAAVVVVTRELVRRDCETTIGQPAGKRVTAPAPRLTANVAAIREDSASPALLFSYAVPDNREALNAQLPAPSPDIHYVRLDRRLIEEKQSPFWQRAGEGRLRLPLPDGTALAVVIQASEMLGPQRFTSVGHLEGRPLSRAVFAYNEGFLHASISDPEYGNFALRAATEELSQFYQLDATLVAGCGGERRPEPAALAAAAHHRARAPHVRHEALALAAAGAPGADARGPVVDVMMVYTPSLLPTLKGAVRAAALQSAFDAALAKVNAAFQASRISARVRLVRLHETSYDEDASAPGRVQDEALTALVTPDDRKMDEVPALRDAVGADLVCLALSRRDSMSSGLSFLLDRPHAHGTPEFAYSVVQYSDIAGTNLVPHEFGHVLGCAHDRDNALSGEGAYSYSFGYKFFGADGWRYHDIMAYPPGIELSYFSNPEVVLPLPIGAALGVPAGQPGEADSARTIEQTAFAAASFRLRPPGASGAAAVVNVATRAFVGAENRALVGGFVIEGRQPKRVLVRGVGPALAAFGVTNALSDPRLKVFAPGAVLENDNWPAQPEAAEIVNATMRVGGFPLDAGGRDAALLLTLSPGAYVAVVDAVAGASGSALLEAYAVDGGPSRLVNVSARGYADTGGRELLGGFVVQGAPGSTRRMLIRVLGPTLARDFALNDVLFDPMLELRGGRGELLIENDDWASGARGADAERDDFQPLVRYYTEQQIVASGLAPRNRREPCVLVDLPPGNYTVVARPFEHHQQRAEPGVGLIEVYELAP